MKAAKIIGVKLNGLAVFSIIALAALIGCASKPKFVELENKGSVMGVSTPEAEKI